MTVHADSGFFAKKYNENADEEEKAAYREAFSGLLSSFANRFTSEIESDEAYDNYVTAFGDVQYVVVDLLEKMEEKEKEKWAPMLNVACDMAFDDRTCVENVRQCYRLLNKLIEKCKSNLKKLGDEVLLDRSSNSSSPEGSQLNASRLKKLARAFETCGDFECQKEITIISIHLLHSKKCDSFDPTTEHGMKTIKTLFPKRSEEILLLQETLVKLGDSCERFPLVVDFVRQSNALLGSRASVFSYECEKAKFGEFEVADNLVHFSKYMGLTLNVRLEKGKDDATTVDVIEQNIRVANFNSSTNTLTIGIFQKCEGMLERDVFDAKDDGWISLTFKPEDVPGVKNCVRVYAESGSCKAMEKLRDTLDASARKKTSRGVEVTYDLQEILTQPESTTDLMEPEPLPRNPTATKDLAADEEKNIAKKATTKAKESKKKALPTLSLPSPSSKPVRAAKAKANAKLAAQNAAYQSALKEKGNAEKIASPIEAKKTQQQKKKIGSLRDIFANDNDQKEEEEDDEEGNYGKNSFLDQTDESLDAGDEDAAKVPSFEEDEEGDALLEKKKTTKKKTNERTKDHNNNYDDTKTPKATIKVPKTAPLRKPEKSTVRFAPPTKETTSRGMKAALAPTTTKNKKESWREKMSNLTNTLHVDDDEENNIDAQLGKSGKSEKETLSYNKAKIGRRLKFSTGKKADEATTLKRKNRGDDDDDNNDDFAYRDDEEDEDDDGLLLFSSQNESDERVKKRAATATKVVGLKSSDEDFGMEEEEDDEDDDLPSAAAAENQFDAIKNAMETLRRTKTREAESKVQKLSKSLEMDFEKASSKLAREVSENVQTSKRFIDETAHQLEKEEQKILARLEDITKKFTRDFERERDLLLAVKSKGKSAYKNANAAVKAVVEEANDEWNALQTKMREKSAKFKRECKRIRRECAEQTDLKKMLLNMAEMI